jgi:uncharacterized protein (DUF736 family)
MAYEPKDMSGSLFKNDRKEKDTHADYRGSALINGVGHWLDAWINEDRNGNKYMSLKFKRKDQAIHDPRSSAHYAPQAFDQDSDSVPF